MPNYHKAANKLFQITDRQNSEGIDHLTQNLRIQRRGDQVFAIPQKPQTQPQQSSLTEGLPRIQHPGRLSNQKQSARAAVPINPFCQMARPVPDEFKSTNQSFITGKYRKPNFFEEMPDAPRQNRNLSHVQFSTSIADGPMDDIYQSSTQRAHGCVPSGVPVGYGNPAIAAAHSTYVHNGKFQKKVGIARRPQGVY